MRVVQFPKFPIFLHHRIILLPCILATTLLSFFGINLERIKTNPNPLNIPLIAKSYRQQNIVLLAVSVILLIAVFNLNIKRTWRVYQDFKHNKNQVVLAASAPAEIANLRNKLSVLRSTNIKPYQRELLLEKTTSFCNGHGLLVKSFPEALALENNGASIVTNSIEVEGNYLEMVKLLYHLEEGEKLGSVSSVKFQLAKDRRTRKEVLRSTIFLRNIENTVPHE